MQDPTITAFQLIQSMKPLSHHHNFQTEQEQQQNQQQEQLKCPRCDSTNTKFCYYNNYNLSQPRHFCKNCRRYWTKGGALRNIPVGGGSRKTTKRSSSSSTSSTKRHVQPPAAAGTASSISASNSATVNVSGSGPTRVEQDRGVMNIGGSFSSLMGSSGHFGTLLEGLNSNGSGMKMVQVSGFGGNFGSDEPGLNSGSGRNPGLDIMQSHGNSEGFLSLQNGDGGHGWSDLAIYTRGSSFL